jgi:hypothetical protein
VEEIKQWADLEVAQHGMAETAFAVDVVVVASSVLRSLYIAVRDQVSD